MTNRIISAKIPDISIKNLSTIEECDDFSCDEGGKEEDSNGGVRMASLIPPNGVIFNYADVAPSPSKDYCQVVVTTDQVVFRVWKVTIRQNSRVTPHETKDSYDDFLHDDRAQSELSRVFGKRVLEYIVGLARGHIDYLPRLSKPLLIQIIRYLDLEDVSRLACVSKQFKQLCTSDELWELIYKDHSDGHANEALSSLAEAIGWRKLFFTNKLQLQMQLRRQASRQKSEILPMREPSDENLDDWKQNSAIFSQGKLNVQ